MTPPLKAGGIYFLVVFGIAFLLGVLLGVPRIGEVAAVCLELPFLLIAAWPDLAQSQPSNT